MLKEISSMNNTLEGLDSINLDFIIKYAGVEICRVYNGEKVVEFYFGEDGKLDTINELKKRFVAIGYGYRWADKKD
jgi:hypothetical protein